MPEALHGILIGSIPAILLLLAWGVKLLTDLIKTKVTEISVKTDNETIKTYLEIVSDNAVNVVESLNQTIVDGLKESSEDGKLSKEEAENIKNTAITMLTETLSDDIIELLDQVFGDSKAYLSNLIERTVVKVKENHPVG